MGGGRLSELELGLSEPAGAGRTGRVEVLRGGARSRPALGVSAVDQFAGTIRQLQAFAAEASLKRGSRNHPAF